MLFRRRFDVNIVTSSNQRDDVASMRRGKMTKESEFKSIHSDMRLPMYISVAECRFRKK